MFHFFLYGKTSRTGTVLDFVPVPTLNLRGNIGHKIDSSYKHLMHMHQKVEQK